MTRQRQGNGRGRKDSGFGAKPLLSVEEAAILLGETRSTVYRALAAGTLPLPVYVIGARRRSGPAPARPADGSR